MDADDIVMGGIFGAFLALAFSWVFKFKKRTEEEPESLEDMAASAAKLREKVSQQAQPNPVTM